MRGRKKEINKNQVMQEIREPMKEWDNAIEVSIIEKLTLQLLVLNQDIVSCNRKHHFKTGLHTFFNLFFYF